MSTLALLPSLPAISSSTGTDYSGLSPDEVTDAMNAPMTDDEINAAMGYNAVTPISQPTNPASIFNTAPSSPTVVPTTPTASASPSAASSATGVLTSIWNVITGNIENGIFVILGLLLIAAGIFAFKTTQTVVQVAGKAATRATELGAAAAA